MGWRRMVTVGWEGEVRIVFECWWRGGDCGGREGGGGLIGERRVRDSFKKHHLQHAKQSYCPVAIPSYIQPSRQHPKKNS